VGRGSSRVEQKITQKQKKGKKKMSWCELPSHLGATFFFFFCVCGRVHGVAVGCSTLFLSSYLFIAPPQPSQIVFAVIVAIRAAVYELSFYLYSFFFDVPRLDSVTFFFCIYMCAARRLAYSRRYVELC
jgi:hypothetical protein